MIDRSGTQLSIFVSGVEVDYKLPKYNEDLEEIKDDIIQDIIKDPCSPFNTKEEIEAALRDDPDSLLDYSAKSFEDLNEKHNKIDTIIKKYKVASSKNAAKVKISADEFDKMSSKDLIVLTENLGHQNRLKTSLPSFNNIVFDDGGFGSTGNKETKWSKFKKSISSYFKKKEKEKKNALLIDVLEFFRLVKLSTENSISEYVERSQPYLLAIEQARDMGQQALVDKLLSGMFVAKYESILRASGFNKYIQESTIVGFAKKTQKGLRLDYIKNFARPIPQEVMDLKKKADSLYVFDNYCILHYDPSGKSYEQTAKEKEADRKRKADPILFGLIEGSTKLYYIADWIDEYCDLTLEQFLKVSGLTEKDIEIPKTIKL